MRADVSNAEADLNNIPLDAPRPEPTIIAVGVAKPNAHGHEITNTEIAADNANSVPYPNTSHTIAG